MTLSTERWPTGVSLASEIVEAAGTLAVLAALTYLPVRLLEVWDGIRTNETMRSERPARAARLEAGPGIQPLLPRTNHNAAPRAAYASGPRPQPLQAIGSGRTRVPDLTQDRHRANGGGPPVKDLHCVASGSNRRSGRMVSTARYAK